jgi:hypothetical protein
VRRSGSPPSIGGGAVLAFINAAILIMAAGFHGKGTRLPRSATCACTARVRRWRASCSRGAVLRTEVTLTGTLAGQIVMEGFINLRLRPGSGA